MTPAFKAAATQALMRALVGSCLLALPSLMDVNAIEGFARFGLILPILFAITYLSGALFMFQSYLGLSFAFDELRKARIESGKGRRDH